MASNNNIGKERIDDKAATVTDIDLTKDAIGLGSDRLRPKESPTTALEPSNTISHAKSTKCVWCVVSNLPSRVPRLISV